MIHFKLLKGIIEQKYYTIYGIVFCMNRKLRWIVYCQIAGIFFLLFGGYLNDMEPLLQINWNNLFSLDNLITVILVQGFSLVLGYLYPITIDIFLNMKK